MGLTLKALSHYNVIVQRTNCVRENLFSVQNVGERCKKLRKSSHPLTRLRPCRGLQSFHLSRRPSSVHVAPSQRSYCVLQRSPAFLPSFLPTFVRPSAVHVGLQSSALLYRPSSVRLTTTSQFINIKMVSERSQSQFC